MHNILLCRSYRDTMIKVNLFHSVCYFTIGCMQLTDFTITTVLGIH